VKILGIETSCDETSAAVYETERGFPGTLKSSIVASQTLLHARFGGVVPELSARAHIERLPAVVSEALNVAGCRAVDLDAIAVTVRPGLLSALLCGMAYARGLAMATGRPLYAVDHVKAHVASAFLNPTGPDGDDPSTAMEGQVPAATGMSCGRPLSPSDFPVSALVASGGHTLLVTLKSPVDFELIGTTRDDAVGEAFDKVGQLLGLPFPGGPNVEREAKLGDPAAFRFPIGVIRGSPFDFSFSGLKTAVLYKLAKMPAREVRRRRADVAASFQSAAISALVDRAVKVVRSTGSRVFVLCGGVAANRALRSAMADALAREGASLCMPPLAYCGDTGAQVAVYAYFLIAAGAAPASADLDAETVSELFASAGSAEGG